MNERRVMRSAAGTLRLSIALCLLAAVAAGGALVLAGQPRAAAGVAAGLLLGAGNGYLALRATRSELPFLATSFARLGLLTAAGVAVGLMLGVDVVWTPLLGLAGAQVTLAASATLESVRAQ